MDAAQVKDLHAKIGELTVATIFWKKSYAGAGRRRGMIEPDHPSLSIGQTVRLLSISRSCFYYAPKGETEEPGADAEIDGQFLETPFYGARQMTWHLRAAEGRPVNVKRVRRLMRLMGLMPIYQKPRTSVPAKGHKTYPYLLRGLRSTGPTRSGAPISPTSRWRRVPVPGGDHGLVEPQGPGLAALEHHGRAVLRRGAEGGASAAMVRPRS